MRRPAGKVDGEYHPERIDIGSFLLSEEAFYFGHAGAVAGQGKEEKMEEGRRMVTVALTGTSIDSLLQWATMKEEACRWRLCSAGCTRDLENDGLVHATRRTRVVTLQDLDAMGWVVNLQIPE